MLAKEAIDEYKRIYVKIYGTELNDEEAVRRANNLVALYAAVYGSPHFGQIKNSENADGKNNNNKNGNSKKS